jgi:FkbM family methyltransferase
VRSLRKLAQSVPLLRVTYLWAAGHVKNHRERAQANRLFVNPDVYRKALHFKGPGRAILEMKDGISLAIRQNIYDAKIIREIFVDMPYTRHIQLGPKPVVVDIGGYIGDFTIYAAKHLGAERVIVYEPTLENFTLLQENIQRNGLQDKIVAVNKGVGSSEELVLNVELKESEEIHVSAYWYPEAEKRVMPCVTLEQIFELHKLNSIDLLKVDCEGGEYDIFPTVPTSLFNRIRNIAFEYHDIGDGGLAFRRLLGQLETAGYDVIVDKKRIVSARRK